MLRVFSAALIALFLGCAVQDPELQLGSQPDLQSNPQIPQQGRFYPVQLHLHGSQSEGSASMAAHDAMAVELGTVDVLWWTDHDWRIARHGALDRHDFEQHEETFVVPHRGVPWSRRPDSAWVSWREETLGSVEKSWASLQEKDSPGGGKSLEIGAAGASSDEWATYGVVMTSSAGRLKVSLAADVTVALRARLLTPTGESAQAMITILLSRHPDEQVALVYTLGAEGDSYEERIGSTRRVVIPVPATLGEWTDLELPVTRDAVRHDLGGWDNSLRIVHLGVRVRRGATAGVDVDALRVRTGVDGEEVLQRAEEIARALQEKSGIVHHVGLELSYSAHMNAYLPEIELPDFEAHPYGMTPQEMVAWTHERGGVVSYNHVFGTVPSHRGQYRRRVEWLLQNSAFGADLLEVGYPHRVLPLQSHLKVWDQLSRRGVIIGGVGASDSHHTYEGWRDGNNYVTWVYARSPSREHLLQGLRSRRAFFGDPMLFQGTIDLRTRNGAAMGAVVPIRQEQQIVEVSISDLPKDAEIRWILRGRQAKTIRPPAGDFQRTFTLRTPFDGTSRFVRVEVWLGERGIAFSNCLYFIPADPTENT